MPNFSIPLSGLTAESTALSTIANNLANQNTTGYKTKVVLFSDLFYQNLGTSGSGDPLQLGAGTQVGSTPSMFTQGSVSSTGVSTDVAIQGAGFFVVQDASGVISYTRAGDFSELNNYLVTPSGQQVLGYPADANGKIDTGTGIGPLQLGAGTISPPTATTNVRLTTNLDARTTPTDTPFSTPITVRDSLGAPHVLNFTFTNTGAGQWSYAVSIPAGDLGAAGAVQNGTGTLQFDNRGNLTVPAAGNNPNITITGLADGAADLPFTWQLYDNGVGLLTQVAASSGTNSADADGTGSGSLTKFTIGSDGIILGSFDNGKTQALGQVALASFANNDGLQLEGNTDFSPTLASGQAVLGAPNAGGRGTLSGGALELSNVDIATEFASLIVAQRGYEADAKAVTTFDQITQDTIALKQ